MKKFVSICIPTYNRPSQLRELLDSIDCDSEEFEIVISENNSPERAATREVIKLFSLNKKCKITYHENKTNIGYDANIRKLIELAEGHFIIFMGDDDQFFPGSLCLYIKFLKKNRRFSYVLRSYAVMHHNRIIEYFKYLPKVSTIPKGEKSVSWLFKRSVTLCGFTISRVEALRHSSIELDGTLLYQVFIMAQVCLRKDSIFCDIPIGYAKQSFQKGSASFGDADSEKSRFTSGIISEENSINFTKSYFEVSRYLDILNGTKLTYLLQEELSKFSYPFLSIQRKRGFFSYLNYAKKLELEAGLGVTYYFYVYKWALAILGERLSRKIIVLLKKIIGHTPNL